MNRTRGRRRPGVILAGTLAALSVALPAGAQASSGGVTVMTRNLYLGADLTPALSAGSLGELAVAASAIYSTMIGTDFPERADALAAEIDRNDPDLVGLQEVALWRTDQPADGPATPAQDTTYDFLALLRQALRDRGSPYDVVQVQREADIEVPTSGGFDGRLTMRDAILARRDAGVETQNGDRGNFDTNLVIPNVGGSGIDVTVHRGWTSVDANVRGNRFTFVNTHLEAFNATVREAQAEELVATRGPLDVNGRAIFVGDVNSDDDLVELGEGDADDELAYAVLRNAGLFERSIDHAGTADDRFACCFHNEEIDDPSDEFDHNVDHVMVNRRSIELRRSIVTGEDPALMTPSGLWPSDHGGIVSRLHFSAP